MSKLDRLNAEFDQLRAAVKEKNGDQAARAVNRIRGIDPQVADEVLTRGIAAGRRRAGG